MATLILKNLKTELELIQFLDHDKIQDNKFHGQKQKKWQRRKNSLLNKFYVNKFYTKIMKIKKKEKNMNPPTTQEILIWLLATSSLLAFQTRKDDRMKG